MPSDRAGYTVSVYALDVSPSMGDAVEDAEQGKKKEKLALVKEYVARMLEPKVSSGRKTEAAGILSFGGRTNNQAHQAYVNENPDDEEPPYEHVSSDVAIQTAKPKTLEEVMNLMIGQVEGNPVSALMVALDMIHVHKHTKSWALEITLITDGESAFDQGEYESCLERLDELGVKLTVLGIGFEPEDQAVDKSKTKNKRLSEKFWRTFVKLLRERVSTTTSAEEFMPELGVFEDALAEARLPKPATVNGTLSNIDLFIGSPEVSADEAIRIPIKYSKATMKARPPTLSRAWKPAMDLQAPLQPNAPKPLTSAASQLFNSLAESQGGKGDLASMISSDVKAYSSYVIKKQEPEPSSQVPASQAKETQQEPEEEEDAEMEEEEVAREDIVKAFKYGSSWVPVEADTFEPLNTKKGVEVLGFFPRSNLKRHHLMGEVRFVWPDLTNPRAQIQFSSLVTALMLREMVAVVRWCLKDQAEPVIGVCLPEQDFPEAEKRLDFMYWVKLPFAEDEHNFYFASLTTLKNTSGKVIAEHPLLPTDEQCDLMEEFVGAMNLDEYVKTPEEEEPDPWFDTVRSYNPAIHRIKEAIFHASLTYDLEKDPLPPPHPEITKYFNPPDVLMEKAEPIVAKLKESLNVKKVPLRVRMQKRQKEALRDDEGYIDIDDLFDAEDADEKAKIKGEPSSPGTSAKPKRGRLISNENPLEDFKRLVEGEGDVFRKAIQDLGAVIKENVAESFSKQAYPLAIECLKEMRQTALLYEEVETYNSYLDDLEAYITDPGFKHKDFFKTAQKEGKAVVPISQEEEEAALQGDI